MSKIHIVLLFTLYNFIKIQCAYPPTGDEVQAGSVLLPASRRGRYLANIVRRQAVDGTGIKFNKDADRMNAEAKKKVDVLSEELLPYIIAEQERRTTLYKRVMTAIQNGEKGVTVAEIRNKPPAIIRKGLMYRCPANRAPKEPDGSGIILCDDNIEPTPIMYESCLSAEDKELYVAENKYFFCNRHKIEGPDLPRNGSAVIGCAPCERTSLNYTSARCALEDTDDVVVHYRYYPDRTYKFVTELDPDREVCDHWNPCQIGYIFSLPSPDQATPASELWQFVPQDSPVEHVPPSAREYDTTGQMLAIDPDKRFEAIMKYDINKDKQVIIYTNGIGTNKEHVEVTTRALKDDLAVNMKFDHLEPGDLTKYYAGFTEKNSRRSEDRLGKMKLVLLLDLRKSSVQLTPATIVAQPGTKLNITRINYSCIECTPKNIILRGYDGTISNLDKTKYKVNKKDDYSELEIDFGDADFIEYGEYIVRMQLVDGSEENIKIINLQDLRIIRHRRSLMIGVHYDHRIKYDCMDCEIIDIINKGKSVLHSGHVSHIAAANTIIMNFPSYSDDQAGVYIVLFTKGGKSYYAIAAIFESVNMARKFVTLLPPKEGENYENKLNYKCDANRCDVSKVMLNGFVMNTLNDINKRTNNYGSVAYYILADDSIFFRIMSYTRILAGVIQVEFMMDGEPVTKNIFEIGDKVEEVTDFEINQDNEHTTKSIEKNRSPGSLTADVENDQEVSKPEESISKEEEGKRDKAESTSPQIAEDIDGSETTTLAAETSTLANETSVLANETKIKEGGSER